MESGLTPIQAAQEDQAFQFFLARSFGGCRQVIATEDYKITAYFWRGRIYIVGFEPM